MVYFPSHVLLKCFAVSDRWVWAHKEHKIKAKSLTAQMAATEEVR